jgi:hypothetical protein
MENRNPEMSPGMSSDKQATDGMIITTRKKQISQAQQKQQVK